MLNNEILEGISSDQFKIFLLERIKRMIKNGYKSHLRALDVLHQKQLKIIYENQNSLSKEKLEEIKLLDQSTYSEYRKSILDIGNNTSREVEKLFDDIVIGIDNKTINHK